MEAACPSFKQLAAAHMDSMGCDFTCGGGAALAVSVQQCSSQGEISGCMCAMASVPFLVASPLMALCPGGEAALTAVAMQHCTAKEGLCTGLEAEMYQQGLHSGHPVCFSNRMSAAAMGSFLSNSHTPCLDNNFTTHGCGPLQQSGSIPSAAQCTMLVTSHCDNVNMTCTCATETEALLISSGCARYGFLSDEVANFKGSMCNGIEVQLNVTFSMANSDMAQLPQGSQGMMMTLSRLIGVPMIWISGDPVMTPGASNTMVLMAIVARVPNRNRGAEVLQATRTPGFNAALTKGLPVSNVALSTAVWPPLPTNLPPPVKFKSNFPVTGALSAASDATSVNSPAVKLNVAATIAQQLSLPAGNVVVHGVYLCPDASQPKCSSRRRLLWSAGSNRNLAGGTTSGGSYIVVEYDVIPTPTMNVTDITAATQTPAFKTASASVVKTQVEVSTGVTVTVAAPTTVDRAAVVVAPAPSPGHGHVDPHDPHAGHNHTDPGPTIVEDASSTPIIIGVVVIAVILVGGVAGYKFSKKGAKVQVLP